MVDVVYKSLLEKTSGSIPVKDCFMICLGCFIISVGCFIILYMSIHFYFYLLKKELFQTNC